MPRAVRSRATRAATSWPPRASPDIPMARFTRLPERTREVVSERWYNHRRPRPSACRGPQSVSVRDQPREASIEHDAHHPTTRGRLHHRAGSTVHPPISGTRGPGPRPGDPRDSERPPSPGGRRGGGGSAEHCDDRLRRPGLRRSRLLRFPRDPHAEPRPAGRRRGAVDELLRDLAGVHTVAREHPHRPLPPAQRPVRHDPQRRRRLRQAHGRI